MDNLALVKLTCSCLALDFVSFDPSLIFLVFVFIFKIYVKTAFEKNKKVINGQTIFKKNKLPMYVKNKFLKKIKISYLAMSTNFIKII